MNEFNAINLEPGQFLKVEVDQEVLIGRLKYIDKKRRLLELEAVHDFNTGYQYTCSQLLPLSDVKSINTVNDDDQSSATDSSAIMTDVTKSTNLECGQQKLHNDSSCRERRRALPGMNLSHWELQHIEKQIANFVYITQCDDKYHMALDDIRAQSVVSLLLEPAHTGRRGRTSLIALATPSTVYLFDMLALQRMARELQTLLEADRPRKAVHYSHQVAEQLRSYSELKLNGISDTFVALCLVTGEKRTLGLQEAIQETFNIPPLYFARPGGGQMTSDTFHRPLSKPACRLFAKLAIFQLKLHEYLLHCQLLAQYYVQCDKFSQTFSEIEAHRVPITGHEEGFDRIATDDAQLTDMLTRRLL